MTKSYLTLVIFAIWYKIRQSSIGWKSGKWTLTLKVKGGGEETWPLPQGVKEAIDEYLRLDRKRRSVRSETSKGGQYVFQPVRSHRTGINNRGLTRQMIGNVVRK